MGPVVQEPLKLRFLVPERYTWLGEQMVGALSPAPGESSVTSSLFLFFYN